MDGRTTGRQLRRTVFLLIVAAVMPVGILDAQIRQDTHHTEGTIGNPTVSVIKSVYDFPDTLTGSIRKRLVDRESEDLKLIPTDGDTLDRFAYSLAVSGDVMVMGAYADDDSGSESGSAYIFRNNGTTWVEEAKLIASDADALDRFGRSVAISGGVAVIGAYADGDTLISEHGSAYVFRYDGASWVEEAKLTASDADTSDHFGWSVSVSGGVAVIGAYADGDTLISGHGSAYVFRYDGASWVEEAKLTASDADTSDNFGWSVAVEGNIAVIGALADDDSGRESGSTYIFRYDGSSWIEEIKLTASNADSSAYFGRSTSVSGGIVVVGADGGRGRIAGTGSAYVYRYDGTTWVEEARLYALDGMPDDHFGSSVSASGDIVVVGSYGGAYEGAESGLAYLFHYNGAQWREKALLFSSDGDSLDSFGQAVSVSGGVAAVGAYQDDDNGGDSGSAYLFEVGRYFDKKEKILASDGKGGDNFGLSLSISGNVTLVGAHGDNDLGADAGTAFVFRHDGRDWIEEQKLTASDGDSYDRFGWSVAISGDVAAVGAIYDEELGTQSGSAYIFRYDGSSWVEEIKLLASDGDTLDSFGYSVAVFGDVVLVGASLDDDLGESSGSVYVFRYDGSSWVEEAKLLASDGTSGDYFGYDVSLFGDVAVISAVHGGHFLLNTGVAYVFRYNGSSWVEEAKLYASDSATADFFGHRLSVWGSVVIIGAYATDDYGSESGSAYVFRYDGSAWNEEAELHSSDGVAGDRFGYALSLWGNTAVVGAYGDDDRGPLSGSAYIFRYDGSSWYQADKVIAADGQREDWFGRCVSINGDVVLIGANGDDDNGAEAGSSYLFSTFGD